MQLTSMWSSAFAPAEAPDNRPTAAIMLLPHDCRQAVALSPLICVAMVVVASNGCRNSTSHQRAVDSSDTEPSHRNSHADQGAASPTGRDMVTLLEGADQDRHEVFGPHCPGGR